MRICLLCYRGNPYSGGQGIYLKYIAEELVRQGHTVHAIVGPPYPLEMRGVTVHRIDNRQYYVMRGAEFVNPADPFDIFNPVNLYEYAHSRLGAFPEISSFSYRAYLLLRRLHRRFRYDIIHDNQSLGYGLLLMKTLGVPVIATIHHPLTIDLENVLERVDTFKRKVKSVMFYPTMMQGIVSRRLDHVITVSEDSKRRVHSDFGVPLERQTVVYNGIDRSIFRPLRDVKRKPRKVIFVGNVEDGKKGFAYLLKALSMMKETVRVTAVDGGSPHHRITEHLMKTLRIRSSVEFTGKISVEQLVRHYGESEIAVVPSVHEGFGFPAGEAMACGVPVISSDGGALPEVVGDAGVVVPARDERALAAALDGLAGNRKALARMGDAGIERVRELFDWEKSVGRMADLYESLVLRS
ncbi:MAG: glycosyltransferase family 4 protein [Spirochaetes bacterium]|nr:glycosyltransferase family 4 protein [Spirochaetota bacterium]